MRGKAYDDEGWEAILDCLTVDEMVEMVRLGGWQTMAINSISKPMSSDQDGPAGISGELIMSSVETMGFPNQEMLAATWNAGIGEEFGLLIGEDGLSVNVQGWYAPGAGTHRTPLGGRNFEYYSEDGYLAGVEVVKVMPLWQKWLVAFDCGMALVLLLGVLGLARCYRKNK